MKTTLKRMLSISLLLCILTAGGLAYADQPTVTNYLPVNVPMGVYEPIFTIHYAGSSYDWQVTRSEGDVEGPVIDRTGDAPLGPTLYGTDVNTSVTVPWNYLYDGDFVYDEVGYPHTLTITTGGIDTSIIHFYVNWIVDGLFDQVSFVSWYDATVGKVTWYPNNTVCSFGPQYRDVTPELTDKWYMFTPVDLSVDGTQTFDLIGGSMYVIGSVTVTVEGDTVMVDYKYVHHGVESLAEFFTLFPDYDSITTVEPDEIESMFTFGETYSITNDLNGDTEMLLYICNRATFSDATPRIVRFWPNLDWRIAQREAMLESIGK
ncbi:MAG TPA: hypothetical protein PKU80_06350 [Candidatus Limiplasma sp.]|nr:hypothetical protein [Candidatus Limiplasma sp.]HRX08980.1 hypothetical protein [Candidatus Limiplasma sp.]